MALFLCVYLNDFWPLRVTQWFHSYSLYLWRRCRFICSEWFWAQAQLLAWETPWDEDRGLELCQAFECLAKLPSSIFLHMETSHSADPVSDVGCLLLIILWMSLMCTVILLLPKAHAGRSRSNQTGNRSYSTPATQILYYGPKKHETMGKSPCSLHQPSEQVAKKKNALVSYKRPSKCCVDYFPRHAVLR